jgi:hypothetical protein
LLLKRLVNNPHPQLTRMIPSLTNPPIRPAKKSTLCHRILFLQIKIVFAGSFSTDSSNALRKNGKFENCNGLSPLRHPEQPNPPEESEQDPDWLDPPTSSGFGHLIPALPHVFFS